MNIYKGRRRHKGYGVGGAFASYFRSAVPLLKRAGFSTAKEWLKSGSEAFGDLEKGKKPWKKVLKSHAKKAAKRSLTPLVTLGANAITDGIKDVLSEDEISPSPTKRVRGGDIFDE